MLALAGHRTDVSSLAFSPDGAWLASTGTDLSVRLWGVGAWTQRLLEPGDITRHGPATVAFSPDGRWLAAWGLGRTKVYALPAGEMRARFGAADPYRHHGQFAFAPVGHTFAISCNVGYPERPESGLQLWHAGDWEGHSLLAAADFHAFAFNADGSRLVGVVGSQLGFGRVGRSRLGVGGCVVEVATGARLRSDVDWRGWVVASPADPELAVFGGERVLEARHVGTGDLLYEVASAKTFFRGVAFLPDGGSFLAANNDGSAWHVDAATGEVLRTFDWRQGGLRSVAASPDGTLAAAGTARGAILVWDLA